MLEFFISNQTARYPNISGNKIERRKWKKFDGPGGRRRRRLGEESNKTQTSVLILILLRLYLRCCICRFSGGSLDLQKSNYHADNLMVSIVHTKYISNQTARCPHVSGNKIEKRKSEKFDGSGGRRRRRLGEESNKTQTLKLSFPDKWICKWISLTIFAVDCILSLLE